MIAIAALPSAIEMHGTSITARHVGGWLGWLGAGLLSGSLLLMIREPLLVRWFGGLRRMYRWHHALGVAACAVLLTHPIVLAGAMLSKSAARAWHLLSPTTWFPSNALGWFALIGLLVGTFASMAWRVRYALWRRLHFSLSGAVLVGFAHALAYRGITSSLLLAAGPGILALGWRVLRADRGLGTRPYEVERVTHIAAGTSEIVLEPLARPLAVAPGQFIMVAFFEGPHYRGCGEFHPYTVCGSRADGSLILAVKALGDCSTRMQSLEPGVAARVQGPYGTFLPGGTASPSLWIAGGIGITPFVARLRAEDLKSPTELIYTYREPEAAAYLTELREQAEHQPLLGLHPLLAQDDPRPVFALFDDVRDLSSRDVYLCGPQAFVRAVLGELRQRHVPDSNIHVEDFDFRLNCS